MQATFGLSGAVEEDHRRLQLLEDEVYQNIVLIDRLMNDLAQDINRQTAYVNNERQNLTTLSLAIKNGELYGTSLATRRQPGAGAQAGRRVQSGCDQSGARHAQPDRAELDPGAPQRRTGAAHACGDGRSVQPRQPDLVVQPGGDLERGASLRQVAGAP